MKIWMPGEPSQSEGAVDTAIRLFASLQSRLAQCQEAVRTYGRHKDGCKFDLYKQWQGQPTLCTCGLTAALEGMDD